MLVIGLDIDDTDDFTKHDDIETVANCILNGGSHTIVGRKYSDEDALDVHA